MYLDVNDDKELTFKGFVGLYTLQTGASTRDCPPRLFCGRRGPE